MRDSAVSSRRVPPLLGAALASVLPFVAARASSEHNSSPPGPQTSSIGGEVASVDLGRRSLTLVVVSPGGGPRELDLPLDDQSRIVSGGRTLSLDQVRSGSRVLARCASPDARGRRICWVHIRRTWPARVPSS